MSSDRSTALPAQAQAPPTFAETLRRLRRAAGLTQEALAERATLSVRAISDLERGVKQRPQRETLRLLTDALAHTPEERALLGVAAHPHADPPRPPAPPPHNLPAQVTPLVGRTRAVAAAIALLRGDAIRLLTVVGTGGVGKTRLAIAVASGLRDDFADGICFVSLGTIRDPNLLVATIAQTLGLAEIRGQSPSDRLIAHLRDHHLLLVLDNFEHLTSEAIAVANLLAHCPSLKILVTSRVPLHLRGEQELPVPPLPLPGRDGPTTPAALSQSPAIRLFCQRARAVAPDFRLTTENAAAVATICTRLDGLPLAIELAAARIKFLGPTALLARMDQRLPELTEGARDQPARQRTMRDAIAWSYDLLSDTERRLFRRLAVFVGGCTGEAAEVVASEGRTPVTAALWSLVDKNLLHQAKEPDGMARLTMLETIREYGLDCLDEHGETDRVLRRHAVYYLGFARAAEPEIRGVRQAEWLARIEIEHDNFRAALTWTRLENEVETGLALAAALWRFWHGRGYFSEGRGWLEDLLAQDEQSDPRAPAPSRANALLGAGMLAYRQNDHRRARELHEASLALYRDLHDRRGTADAVNALGNVAYFEGDYARALPLYEESLLLCRALDYTWGIAIALNNLGIVMEARGGYPPAVALHNQSLSLRQTEGESAGIAMSLTNLGQVLRSQGDWAGAIPLQEESLALSRELGDQWGIATALNHLAIATNDGGAHGRADALHTESLALSREIGDQRNIALALRGLGDVAYADGDDAEATARYTESIALCRTIGYTRGVIECAERLAQVAHRQGVQERAARLFAAAATLRDSIGAPVPDADRAAYNRIIRETRDALGDDAFAAAWDAAQARSLDDACADSSAAPAPTKRPSQRAALPS
ncbi:MAG: ATP-binding protein [Thermomicrobiales bacterium]